MPSITEFVSNFQHGLRPNLYKVFIAGLSQKLEFTCKTAQLPGRDFGVIEVPYMNKTIPMKGDVVYPEWPVTIMMDEDMVIKTGIEDWMRIIELEDVVLGATTMLEYMRDASVIQLSGAGEEIAEYKFFNLWPYSMAPVELGFEQKDVISELPIVFRYSHWTRLSP